MWKLGHLFSNEYPELLLCSINEFLLWTKCFELLMRQLLQQSLEVQASWFFFGCCLDFHSPASVMRAWFTNYVVVSLIYLMSSRCFFLFFNVILIFQTVKFCVDSKIVMNFVKNDRYFNWLYYITKWQTLFTDHIVDVVLWIFLLKHCEAWTRPHATVSVSGTYRTRIRGRHVLDAV